jgi:hypothetical protein
MSGPVWDVVRCPRCQREIPIRLLPLSATCPCGLYYADLPDYRGWYESREAYEAGKGLSGWKDLGK